MIKTNNKLIVTYLLLSCLTSINIVNAASDNAVVTISGKVIANTCTFDASQSELNPILPNISDRDIKGVGVTGGSKPIKIILKDCGSDVTSVEVNASGIADDNDKMAFKNINTSASAQGVGIYFYQNETGDDKFDPAGNIKQIYSLNKNQDTHLIFRAAYFGVSDELVAGNVQSVVTLKMKYL
ncbi:fimbrial protein [Providencia rettgeri]|uniref:fimbrial protein n=1 Tax=Providencia rettgeri TaxID=587 RepID=UPI00141A2362|nr:fimbrial protein [Providencia rettgeri]EMA4781800.1 type 1 fimbrial protein [Providencia rettgeri]NIH03992.1 type 1 fimbrial protein [Providencia rettgeri]